jgi:hypothetical protein
MQADGCGSVLAGRHGAQYRSLERRATNNVSCGATRSVHHFRISSAVFHVRRVQRRQQCLYFLPLPHGQGSLRPTLAKLAVAPVSNPAIVARTMDDTDSNPAERRIMKGRSQSMF